MKYAVRNKIIMFSLLTCISIVAVFPFYMMIVMGTHYSNDLFKGLKLTFGNYFWENLQTVLSKSFGLFYFNSAYVAVVVTALSLILCSFAGYAFAKYEFKGKKILFGIVLAMLMIPPQLGIIAYTWEMSALGLSKTHIPIIIQTIANPFGAFWMTQYIKSSVPNEVIESGRMDGCGEFGIFFKIVIPFIKPALLSLGLLFFLWSWNNYLVPLVTISNIKLYTVPLGIAVMDEMFRVDYGAQILALSLATLPIIVLFSLFSKSLISGLSSVAVKG